MKRSIKRSFIMIMTLISIISCLFIADTPFIALQNTVYAEDGDASASDDTMLSRGDSGDDVIWLQESLNIVMDAGLTADGDFGGATENAVKEFQGQHGIEQSGIVTKATLEALKTLRQQKETDTSSVTDEEEPTETEDTAAENIEDTPAPETMLPDFRNIPPKDKNHPLSGYWKEYFITMKCLFTNFINTITPVFIGGFSWIGICLIIILIGRYCSQHMIRRRWTSDGFSYNDTDLGAIVGDGCAGGAIKLVAVLTLLSPLTANIRYLRAYSGFGWGKTIITAAFLFLLTAVLGIIAGLVIYLAIGSILRIISENVGVVLGFIAGVVIFLMFNFIPVIMAAWLPYSVTL